MTATTTSARYYATRAEGRYRVIDVELASQDGKGYVAVAASKAKAEEKAAKLNAEAATAPIATEVAKAALVELATDPAVTPEQVAEAARADEAWGIPPVPPMGKAVVAAVSSAAAKGTTRREDGAVILASGLVEGSPEADAAEAAESARFEADHAAATHKRQMAKAAAETKAYRIGRVLREWVLGRVAPADSALVEHITSRNVCYDGTATLRLTEAWAEELSGYATDLENALAAGDPAAAHFSGQARAVATMAVRAARKGLANLY